MTITANITNPFTSLSVMAATPAGTAKVARFRISGKRQNGRVTVTVRMPP